jgi:hypothetical protein
MRSRLPAEGAQAFGGQRRQVKPRMSLGWPERGRKGRPVIPSLRSRAGSERSEGSRCPEWNEGVTLLVA